MTKTILFCVIICALLVGHASADGKFFSPSNDVMQPDQKALLWHDDGRETLILQARYEGDATDFGWVVPVPARPKLDTASPAVFFELAWITRPVRVVPWWVGGSRGFVAGVGTISGVSVVEQAEVGPYDATVLAATRAGALAAWLQEHGYAMPPEAPRVLNSYVDRQWHYVAVRINAQRVHDQLLADLQRIDPEIESLEQAPERLALLVMRTAEAQPARSRKLLARITAITDKAQGVPADLESVFRRGPLVDVHPGELLLRDFDDYHTWRRDTLGGLVGADGAATYMALIRTGVDDRELLRVAAAVGMEHNGNLASLEGALALALKEDVVTAIPWQDSRVARLLWGLAEAGRELPDASVAQLRDDYQTRRTIVQEHSRVPPSDYERIAELRDRAETRILSNGDAWTEATDRLYSRRAIHSEIESAVFMSAVAVETAVSSGAITPLRLDFACDELVYPLYITSLNGAPVDIQLYLLSDHRLEADAFETTFAGRLDGETLKYAPETAKLVASGRDYLTELRSTLAPDDMTADLLFARAPADAPYREKIIVEGSVHPVVIYGGILLSALVFVALAILYVRVRRALTGT